MKTILSFFLGVLLVVLTSATVVNQGLVTFKPATPVSTVSYKGDSPLQFVQQYAAQGYVVSTSSMAAHSSYGFKVFVVMVKY